MSNGEQPAGDGHTITINGATFARGLGANTVSDVSVWLGGGRSAFTASVGVDDESDGGGMATFSVLAPHWAWVRSASKTGRQELGNGRLLRPDL